MAFPRARAALRAPDVRRRGVDVERREGPVAEPQRRHDRVLDRPVDIEQFRRRMRYAVAKIPRLRQRVVPGLGRLSPPTWATDPEFDFDYHVRHLRLPAPGTRCASCYELATRFYEDPFDRTRPLWLFVVIDGLEGGRGALFCKIHHSITDGNGVVRLSELYMERERDADAAARRRPRRRRSPRRSPRSDGGRRREAATAPPTSCDAAGRSDRPRCGAARPASPGGPPARWRCGARIRSGLDDVGEEAVDGAALAVDQVRRRRRVPGGSPLWTQPLAAPPPRVAAGPPRRRRRPPARRSAARSTTSSWPAPSSVRSLYHDRRDVHGRGAEHLASWSAPGPTRPSAATRSRRRACRCPAAR